VLEHLHAHNAVVRAAMLLGPQPIDPLEAEAGSPAQSRAAVDDLDFIELGADAFGNGRGAGLEKREKGAVAAAVVQDALPCETPCKAEPELEPALVAPRHQAVLAEDLFGRVMPFSKDVVRGRLRDGQNLRSRASQAPRNVIQNESRMRRASSDSDWRRTYNTSNLNF
jgi:hypothetical protein